MFYQEHYIRMLRFAVALSQGRRLLALALSLESDERSGAGSTGLADGWRTIHAALEVSVDGMQGMAEHFLRDVRVQHDYCDVSCRVAQGIEEDAARLR